ncbi:hypothetical protein M422DRAFT_71022 [Sphaerobolus stellatus SS14]|uniref:Uncharacterized protein n=1 Tax=Sphaerobolus stellatus (strain SS14) TaxID=990650 RepID=A0A0C9UY41_SPHS4|nr:hypothetical protein M422DRAFT_71022 [Sphaerobolus stellatus SS14]
MHRFRKKSDAKRAQVPDHLIASHPAPSSPNHRDISPEISLSLPPASDFRTSLILPSLSRRFTLLRDSNGDPVSIEDVRTKFAEQRAKGADNHITEEEEDMIVEELGKLRAANATSYLSANSSRSPNASSLSSPTTDSLFSSHQDNYTASIRGGVAPSTTSGMSTTTAYPPSSPSSATSRTAPRYSKRNSNNLFGSSSRFHDTSYMHGVGKGNVNSRSTVSLTGSDSQGGSVRSIRSLQSAENNGTKSIAPNAETQADAANQDKGPGLAPSSSSSVPPKPVLKEFSPHQMGRTTLALEEAIRGIEDEAEETIMIPRRSVSRAGTVNSRTQSPKPTETSTAGTPIPWMTDEPRVDDRDPEEVPVATPINQPPISSPLAQHPAPSKSPSPAPYIYRAGTTSPTPRLPGYIPGMPRPVTPRDVDSDRDDGLTGYSTTPRARSPAIPSNHSHHNSSHSFSPRHHTQSSVSSDVQSQPMLPPSILRSSRGTAPVPPLRTTSPALGLRSRGNSVSGIQVPSPLPSPPPDERFKSDFMMRRPLSPLGGSTAGYSISRPTTPSAGLWQSTSPLAQSYPSLPRNESPRPDVNYHMRNGSFTSNESHGETSQRLNNLANYPASPPWLPQARNGYQDTSLDLSVSSIELGLPLHSPFSTAGAKIAARVPTPISSHRARSPVNDSTAQDPILLNRVLSKRGGPRRMQTPPPQSPVSSVFTSAVQTPSSHSSSNVNVNMYMTTPSPLFSPLLNASSTSLSSSSSYHSWTEKSKKTGWDELINFDETKTDWKTLLDGPNGEVNGSDQSDVEDFENPDQILRNKLGISKKDLIDLQTRLVEDAINKRTHDLGARSPIRRRRMSGSRASISTSRSRATTSSTHACCGYQSPHTSARR